jgi:hypothetical protein
MENSKPTICENSFQILHILQVRTEHLIQQQNEHKQHHQSIVKRFRIRNGRNIKRHRLTVHVDFQNVKRICVQLENFIILHKQLVLLCKLC